MDEDRQAEDRVKQETKRAVKKAGKKAVKNVANKAKQQSRKAAQNAKRAAKDAVSKATKELLKKAAMALKDIAAKALAAIGPEVIIAIVVIVLIMLVIVALLGGAVAIRNKIANFFGGGATTEGKTLSDFDSEEAFLLYLLTLKREDGANFLDDDFFVDAHMSKKDFKKLLNSVIDSNNQTKPVSQEVTYKYKSKQRDYTTVETNVSAGAVPANPNTTVTTAPVEVVREWTSWSGLEEREGKVTLSSSDIEGRYKVYWQDVFAMYQLVAKENLAEWKKQIELEAEETGESVDVNSMTAEEISDAAGLTGLMSEEEVERVIQSVTYNYMYYYDGARGDKKIELDEFDSICYYEADASMFNTSTHQEQGTIKVPISVPIEISNGVEVIVADIDTGTGLLKGYKRMFRYDQLEENLEGIVDNFSWDLYVELIKLLPGAEERAAYYEGIVEAMKDNKQEEYVEDLTIQDVLGEGCPEKIYIGSNCVVSSPSYGSNGNKFSAEYGNWDCSGIGNPDMTLAMKDNITSDQMNALIDKLLDKKGIDKNASLLDGTGGAFVTAQEEFGVSAIGMLAIACNESGYGTSHIAHSKNNFFGWGAEDIDPYTLAWSFNGAEAGIYNVIGKIANNYTYGTYKQDTYRKMRYNVVNGEPTHQYATDVDWHTKKANIRAEIMKLASEMGFGVEYDDIDFGSLSDFNATYIDGLPTVTQEQMVRMIEDACSYIERGEYVWAATGEWNGDGTVRYFDCSGFTTVMYKEHFNIMLPRTSKAQGSSGVVVTADQLQVGDLVFNGAPESPGIINHVRIYMGNGKCIEAASSANDIRVSDLIRPSRPNITYRRYVNVKN